MSSDRKGREFDHGARQATGSVDLYWIPLGAGAHIVRLSGRLFELLSAFVQHRTSCDLYHSALIVGVPEGCYIVEKAPVPDLHPERRGVMAQGPVGMRWIGRYRVFRYEVRCWKDGLIPDIGEAVASPVRLSDDLTTARRILDLLPSVPTPVWGRDEPRAGEMWNSNSVVSWLLTLAELTSQGCTHQLEAAPQDGMPAWSSPNVNFISKGICWH